MKCFVLKESRSLFLKRLLCVKECFSNMAAPTDLVRSYSRNEMCDFLLEESFCTQFCWEVLMWFGSEAAVRVSGAAETVEYFG